MLTKKTITMKASTVINDEIICEHVALLDMDKAAVSFLNRRINEDACKEYRQELREDTAEFEDAAYKLLDELAGKKD